MMNRTCRRVCTIVATGALMLGGCRSAPTASDPIAALRDATAIATRDAERMLQDSPGARRDTADSVTTQTRSVQAKIHVALQALDQTPTAPAMHTALYDYLTKLDLALEEMQAGYAIHSAVDAREAHHEELSNAFAAAEGQEELERSRLAANAASDDVEREMDSAIAESPRLITALDALADATTRDAAALPGFALVSRASVTTAINISVATRM